MSNFFSDIFRGVFKKEEERAISWLQSHKFIAVCVALILIIIFAYLQAPQLVAGIGNLLLARFNDLISAILLVWISVLTYHIYRRERIANERIFVDSFEHGLDQWEYYGGWRTDREGNEKILIVTDSDAGGYARPCRLWNDYLFEFETKIVQSNTAWVIRASDILNYVMLQCGRAEIIPHFRVNGFWFKLDPVPLSITLPSNQWFRVNIRVAGIRVVVTVSLNNQETELLNSTLLEPKVVQAIITQGESTQRLPIVFSYPMGSVGFREWGNTECAHFRNVRVTKL